MFLSALILITTPHKSNAFLIRVVPMDGNLAIVPRWTVAHGHSYSQGQFDHGHVAMVPMPYHPSSFSAMNSLAMVEQQAVLPDGRVLAQGAQEPHFATQSELVWAMHQDTGMNTNDQQQQYPHLRHPHMSAAMITVTDQPQSSYGTGAAMVPKPENENRETKDFVVLEIERRLWLASEQDLRRCSAEGEQSSVCPVCLEEMLFGESVVTACNHCFHIDCCRTSESVGVRDRGYWCCPSCREVITLVKSTTVQNSAITLQLDTDPSNGGTLLAMLQVLRSRNPVQHSLHTAQSWDGERFEEHAVAGRLLELTAGGDLTSQNGDASHVIDVTKNMCYTVPADLQEHDHERRATFKTEQEGWMPALLSGVVDLKTLIEFGESQPQLIAGAADSQPVDERARQRENRKRKMYLLGFLLILPTGSIVLRRQSPPYQLLLFLDAARLSHLDSKRSPTDTGCDIRAITTQNVHYRTNSSTAKGNRGDRTNLSWYDRLRQSSKEKEGVSVGEALECQ
eukprot:753676-Hanusia_phi.AAC.12